MEKLVATTVSLSGPQMDAIRNLVVETGLPLSEHIRRATDAYLARVQLGEICVTPVTRRTAVEKK
jgi:hypothetical protein